MANPSLKQLIRRFLGIRTATDGEQLLGVWCEHIDSRERQRSNVARRRRIEDYTWCTYRQSTQQVLHRIERDLELQQ